MITVTKPIHFAVKGHRKRAVNGPKPKPAEPVGRIPRISKLMALAIRFDKLLDDGVVSGQTELARLCHVTQPRMTQIMNLLHLAPDIQEKILHLPRIAAGRDHITERDLRSVVRHSSWHDQRKAWRLVGESLPVHGNRQYTIANEGVPA
jgi:hypothetical protein